MVNMIFLFNVILALSYMQTTISVDHRHRLYWKSIQQKENVLGVIPNVYLAQLKDEYTFIPLGF